ncbi:hypothetical protein OGAPHI_005672 [Ogataea philodendri]|uniref:Uncharacterized protein n=1 Tax=Ogataea philodendri TaxID=1378263 RepID=A0A9P8T1Z2_9ASCO|nr:uncharacterized protein OGAPHI_005672 [Ogataea philodendri]KAH3662420.1 hypothetical protein OGAPHI_005672 [Ogataea philodendri]
MTGVSTSYHHKSQPPHSAEDTTSAALECGIGGRIGGYNWKKCHLTGETTTCGSELQSFEAMTLMWKESSRNPISVSTNDKITDFEDVDCLGNSNEQFSIGPYSIRSRKSGSSKSGRKLMNLSDLVSGSEGSISSDSDSESTFGALLTFESLDLRSLENELLRWPPFWGLLVYLGNVFKQVDNSGGVTVLVVVPGDKLDEGWGQQDTSLSVENRGSAVGNEVGGNNILVSVTENSRKWTLRSLLDGSADVLVSGWLLQVDGQVNNGNVGGWHSQRHTGQLTGKRRENLTDGLGGTGGGWNDVARSSSSSSPVLVRWTVDGLLGSGDGVNGGHQTILDSVSIVDDLSQCSQTVCSTRSIREDLDVWSVLVLIHTHHEHWGVLGWSSDDNLLGTGINVLLSALQSGEHSGGVQDVVNALLTPWDVSWVSLLENLNLVTVNHKVLSLGSNLTLVVTVGRIVLEHVSGVVWSNEWIIDGDHGDVLSCQGNSQNESANSSETINTNFVSHLISMLPLYKEQ